MSRASVSLAHRPLSTTEELEKLEQSITLTLQGPFGREGKNDGKGRGVLLTE